MESDCLLELGRILVCATEVTQGSQSFGAIWPADLFTEGKNMLEYADCVFWPSCLPVSEGEVAAASKRVAVIFAEDPSANFNVFSMEPNRFLYKTRFSAGYGERVAALECFWMVFAQCLFPSRKRLLEDGNSLMGPSNIQICVSQVGAST
jgi:hypothetical protein